MKNKKKTKDLKKYKSDSSKSYFLESGYSLTDLSTCSNVLMKSKKSSYLKEQTSGTSASVLATSDDPRLWKCKEGYADFAIQYKTPAKAKKNMVLASTQPVRNVENYKARIYSKLAKAAEEIKKLGFMNKNRGTDKKYKLEENKVFNNEKLQWTCRKCVIQDLLTKLDKLPKKSIRSQNSSNHNLFQNVNKISMRKDSLDDDLISLYSCATDSTYKRSIDERWNYGCSQNKIAIEKEFSEERYLHDKDISDDSGIQYYPEKAFISVISSKDMSTSEESHNVRKRSELCEKENFEERRNVTETYNDYTSYDSLTSSCSQRKSKIGKDLIVSRIAKYQNREKVHRKKVSNSSWENLKYNHEKAFFNPKNLAETFKSGKFGNEQIPYRHLGSVGQGDTTVIMKKFRKLDPSESRSSYNDEENFHRKAKSETRDRFNVFKNKEKRNLLNKSRKKLKFVPENVPNYRQNVSKTAFYSESYQNINPKPKTLRKRFIKRVSRTGKDEKNYIGKKSWIRKNGNRKHICILHSNADIYSSTEDESEIRTWKYYKSNSIYKDSLIKDIVGQSNINIISVFKDSSMNTDDFPIKISKKIKTDWNCKNVKVQANYSISRPPCFGRPKSRFWGNKFKMLRQGKPKVCFYEVTNSMWEDFGTCGMTVVEYWCQFAKLLYSTACGIIDVEASTRIENLLVKMLQTTCYIGHDGYLLLKCCGIFLFKKP